MKITKEYPGLVLKDYCYEFQGSIESEAEIVIDLEGRWLKVTGSLTAKTYIKAGGGIEAGWGIKAGEGILSGLYVRAQKVIKFKYNLWAGTATWKQPEGEDCEVVALRVDGVVKSGTVRLLATDKEA